MATTTNMPDFESLKSKIHLSGSPVESGHSAEEWERFEQASGTTLPADYKSYINTYGTGCLSELVWILNPFSKAPRFNMLSFLEKKKQAFSTFEALTKMTYPHRLFQEGRGILPFGFTDNGDTLYWKMSGEKSEPSSVLVFDSREHLLIEEYRTSFSGFLLDLLNKSIESKIINTEDVRGNGLAPLSQ